MLRLRSGNLGSAPDTDCDTDLVVNPTGGSYQVTVDYDPDGTVSVVFLSPGGDPTPAAIRSGNCGVTDVIGLFIGAGGGSNTSPACLDNFNLYAVAGATTTTTIGTTTSTTTTTTLNGGGGFSCPLTPTTPCNLADGGQLLMDERKAGKEKMKTAQKSK